MGMHETFNPKVVGSIPTRPIQSQSQKQALIGVSQEAEVTPFVTPLLRDEPEWCGVSTRRLHRIAALAYTVALLTILIIGIARLTTPDSAMGSSLWHRSIASWYGTSELGHRTACGKTLTRDSYWVAALKPELAHCGAHVTICHIRRCLRVQVLDRGAWRRDNRDWDLTLRAHRVLHCSDLCNVRWRRGW